MAILICLPLLSTPQRNRIINILLLKMNTCCPNRANKGGRETITERLTASFSGVCGPDIPRAVSTCTERFAINKISLEEMSLSVGLNET